MKRMVCALLLLLALLVGGGTALAAGGEGAGSGVAAMAEEFRMVKGAVAGSAVRFSATDFKQAMGIRRFDAITVTALPDEAGGTLYFGSEELAVPATVPRGSLDNLRFVPKDDGVKEASFRFTCESYAGGEELLCMIRFAEKKNEAPTVSDVAASREVSTFRSLAAEGRLCATDPEGDEIEFIVISYPKRGTLSLTPATGEFVYTPRAGYTGDDSFTYVVRDYYGNYSEPETVRVTVDAAPEGLVFCDLTGTTGALPAIALAEENIMTGVLVGDGLYFEPDATLLRGEFLVMAMKAVGITPRAGLLYSAFDDDGEIPEGLRPYIATAQEGGYIVGELSDAGLVFRAEEPITRGEAAKTLARLMELSAPESAPTFADEGTVTSSVLDAARALAAMGIFQKTEEGMLDAEAPLTRAAAAEMLYATLLACR